MQRDISSRAIVKEPGFVKLTGASKVLSGLRCRDQQLPISWQRLPDIFG